jgi:phage shock protein PspC (stress-responsive transcriptional regulator)
VSATVVSGSARSLVERAAGRRWVVSGVAAELARRLRAEVGLIRVLLILAAWAEPAVLAVYALAALAIPRGDRRLPSWSGVVAAARFGLFYLAIYSSGPYLAANESFELGPAIWLVHGGIAVAALLLLLASRPDADPIDEATCRRQVLLALPVIGLAAAVVAGMALFPQVRWELVAPIAAATAGVLAVLGRASVPFAATFAAVVVFFAGAGVRLDGGIGDRHLLPGRGGDLVVRRAAGNVVVDLHRVRRGPVTLHATVGLGRLEVVLPPQADVSTRLHVGRGRIDARASGRGVDVELSPSGPGTATPNVKVRIVADVGVGSIGVHRVDGQYNGPNDL